MSLWRQLSRGFRALTNRGAVDEELADEVQHYLELTAAAHRAKGLSHDEALRAARIELGTVIGLREEVRSYGWENAVESLLADLRFAARRLRGDPAFTGIALLTLALGIGGTTAIFSAVNPILFESLPYPQPNRLVALWEMRADDGRTDGTFGMYRQLSERAQSFDAVALAKPWLPTLIGAAEPERLNGQRVSATFFRVLGVTPVAGRDFGGGLSWNAAAAFSASAPGLARHFPIRSHSTRASPNARWRASQTTWWRSMRLSRLCLAWPGKSLRDSFTVHTRSDAYSVSSRPNSARKKP